MPGAAQETGQPRAKVLQDDSDLGVLVNVAADDDLPARDGGGYLSVGSTVTLVIAGPSLIWLVVRQLVGRVGQDCDESDLAIRPYSVTALPASRCVR